jgi:uncharacterized protein (TIGR00255 family)
MIRSMTGYARSERRLETGTLIWEIRSVNHRYLETSLRLPEELRGLEGQFRNVIALGVKRGKVDANLQWRGLSRAKEALEVDEAFLEELIVVSHDVARRATARGGSLEASTALDLLRWPGVLRERERDVTPLGSAAQDGLAEALAALTRSRESEGERIAAMLTTRCTQVEALVATVRTRLPDIQSRLRQRLLDKLSGLTLPPEVQQDRLEQELALLVTKMDVDEEIDRLLSHVVEVNKALTGDEPAGRRLDFLMQEFNREANTLSSKSQDADTTRIAVDLKVLIEQMREQIQNIE